MKIGIFLAYGPRTKMGQEGLGRYLGGLVKGFAAKGQEILIITPRWSVDTLCQLFRDFDVPDDSVSFSVLERPPVFWGILDFMGVLHHKEKRIKKYRVLRTGIDVAEKFVGIMVSVSNGLLFAALVVLTTLIGCILLPFLILAALLGGIAYLAKALMKKQKIALRRIFGKIVSVTQRLSGKGIGLDRYAYQRLGDATVEALVKKANRQNVDVWFVPALFWPGTSKLRQVRVITAPDLVTEEFPYLCAGQPGFVSSTQTCRATIQTGEYFITYCDYLRDTLLNDRYGKEQVCVIAHPLNSMLSSIQIDPEIEKRLNAKISFTDAFANEKLDTLWPHIKYWQKYWVNFNFVSSFRDVRYIFYASQARPYKNILNLLRAYRKLIVERYINVKLILTCDLKMVPELHKYVEEHGMQPDVLAFQGVDGQELASLYRCAELVVNPTLYEGGFPFTFGEGMSVGTPSVMSDIPQVRSVVQKYGLENVMLFDPNDPDAIAEKIGFGLAHKAELYQQELPMYRDMESRTEEVVAQEYIEAFQRFIDHAKEHGHG